jgi:hypothetical protein
MSDRRKHRDGLGLVMLAAVFLAACSVDTVEWESTGYAVEAVEHHLDEEHGLDHPAIECIQREAQGAFWECRAHAGEEEFECEAHFGIRERLKSVHCEPKEHEEEPAEG